MENLHSAEAPGACGAPDPAPKNAAPLRGDEDKSPREVIGRNLLAAIGANRSIVADMPKAKRSAYLESLAFWERLVSEQLN